MTVSGSDGIQDGGQRDRRTAPAPGCPANSSRRQVGDRTHQQTARAAAERHQVLRPGHAGVDEMACHRDEVGEGVLLLQQLAVLVPQPAHLAAAADVGDRRRPCRGPAATAARSRTADPRRTRRRRSRRAASGAGNCRPGAVDDRDRHPGAVGGDRPVAALDVVLGAVVAEHRLLAQQRCARRWPGRCRRCAPG